MNMDQQMQLQPLQPSDILDVNLGIQRQRNKVDFIKRRVARTNSTKSFTPINDVAKELQKVVCYQKRKGVWKVPTIPALYMYISKMVKNGSISSAYSEDVTMPNGRVITLVSYPEVRRTLLDHKKFALQTDREFGPMEPNPQRKGRSRKPVSFWARIIRWLMMFNKEVV